MLSPLIGFDIQHRTNALDGKRLLTRVFPANQESLDWFREHVDASMYDQHTQSILMYYEDAKAFEAHLAEYALENDCF